MGQSVAIGAEWLAMGASSARLGNGAVMLVKKDQTGEFSTSITSELVQPIVPGAGVNESANNFGKAIAIGRNTLIIGALRTTWQGVETGLVFVYKLVNGSWSFSKMIAPPSFNFGGNFGEALALSNDEQKVIIGASTSHKISGNRTTGSALIYTNTSGTT